MALTAEGAVMPRVLILYGTTEGHTRAIARAIAEPLSRAGIEADVVRAGLLEPAVGDYDAIIVAASVHAGRYQKCVEQWVRAHVKEFGARPTAFVSVSLSVMQRGDAKVMADLDAMVKRFTDATGWQPGMVKHVAGALLYTQYNVFKRWIMKRIVAKAGGATDTSHDYDYTNWAEVRAFAEDFRCRLGPVGNTPVPVEILAVP
jgi:menaquinone-dependent protoporphyrinogen oxidase